MTLHCNENDYRCHDVRKLYAYYVTVISTGIDWPTSRLSAKPNIYDQQYVECQYFFFIWWLGRDSFIGHLYCLQSYLFFFHTTMRFGIVLSELLGPTNDQQIQWSFQPFLTTFRILFDCKLLVIINPFHTRNQVIKRKQNSTCPGSCDCCIEPGTPTPPGPPTPPDSCPTPTPPPSICLPYADDVPHISWAPGISHECANGDGPARPMWPIGPPVGVMLW